MSRSSVVAGEKRGKTRTSTSTIGEGDHSKTFHLTRLGNRHPSHMLLYFRTSDGKSRSSPGAK
jgi:hypothetical protein